MVFESSAGLPCDSVWKIQAVVQGSLALSPNEAVSDYGLVTKVELKLTNFKMASLKRFQ